MIKIKTIKYVLFGKPGNILRKIMCFGRVIPFNKKDKKFIESIFTNKTGIRIGGKLRGFFEKIVNQSSKELIDTNAATKFFIEKNKWDYLTDATNLNFAKDSSVDFVVSSHLLEHISNPIKAILEWKRVLKKGGIIYSAVPNKKYTFDHKRKRTLLSHLINDYNLKITIKDTTHIKEFIEKYDPDMGIQTKKELKDFIQENPMTNIHHHVWIKQDLKELFEYLNLEILFLKNRGNTIHIIGRKNDY